MDGNRFDSIKNVVSELKKIILNGSDLSKQLFNDYKYILNVTYKNIPSCPNRMVKIVLKHGLMTDDDDVILFVRDLHRGSKNYQETIRYFQDLLREKNVTGIRTIMPFEQLRQEYGSYEMKIKLSKLYENYLCDGAVVGHVVGFLGRKFQKYRGSLYAVRMNTANLAKEIEKTKMKTSFRCGGQGSLISIPVGHHMMTAEQITENIVTVISQLKTNLPGGISNVRSIYIRINVNGTSSLPVYISTAQRSSKILNAPSPKAEKLNDLTKKLKKTLTKFHMPSNGKFKSLSFEITKRKKCLGEFDSLNKTVKVKKRKEEIRGKKYINKSNRKES